MPLGAARITLLAKTQVTAQAEVIRRKVGISAFGDAQVSTAQSQFGGASLLLDGTGDYLDSSLFDTPSATEPYTIEGWIRRNVDSGTFEYWAQKGWPANGVLNRSWFWGIAPSGKFDFIYASSDSFVQQLSTTFITTGTWFHIAVSNDGTTTRLYVNGTQENTWTSASINLAPNFAVRIGAHIDGSTSFVNGHLDEFRISNTARYTTNFAPQTQPHVNDANTLLLLHMDGTNASTFFEDDNGVRAPLTMRAIGDAQVSTAQSVFGGASAVFDGTGDYLVSGLTSNFGFGTGDFTLEARVRFNSLILQAIISARQASGGFFGNVMALNNQRLAWSNGSVFVQGTTVLTTGVFYHLAISRQSGNLRFWIDGVLDLDVTDNANVGTAQRLIAVGAFEQGSSPINGHIDEVRISNTARYTANFTPATTPFVNDANTLLLLHMDGTDASTVFRDDNGVRATSSVFAKGDTVVSTTQSQFGGASAEFSVEDVLVVNPAATMDFSGDFTWEMWVRGGPQQDPRAKIINSTVPSVHAGLAAGIFIDYNGSKIRAFINGGDRATANSFNNTTWVHIALQRTGQIFEMWLNGTQFVNYDGSANIRNYSITTSHFLPFGGNWNQSTGAVTDELTGYIDEVRLSTVARYASGASITVPTESFQNDDNTVLLLHMDGTNGSTTFTDDTGVTLTHQYT